jgi:N,N-dimethylformamidase beta subunit-like, C-terminal
MVRFLERYRYPVSYTTSESVDEDPWQLLSHRGVIGFGHSEYWSLGQRASVHLGAALRVSLLFLGSDTMAWRVRYAPASAAASEAGERDHTIIAYKEFAARDPDSSDPSGLFPDGGAALTGSSYVGCITPRIPVPGSPSYRYYEWSPSPALQPPWLFADTGITATTRIPGIVGYELDRRTSQTPSGTQLVGSGSAPCMGSLEAGAPPFRGSFGVAETTLYTARSGALVFNSGTLGWELGLEPVPSASPDAPLAPEPQLVALTRNLLGHVLRKSR